MTAEMQQELEATRTELRKGILELPQETADTAAHMRRVIVDQIEALAELNRIVARHGRGLDAIEPAARRMEPVEPVVRRAEPVEAAARRGAPVRSRRAPMAARGRSPPASARDITGVIAPPVMPARRAEAPSLSPAQAGGGRTRLAVRSAHARLARGREPTRGHAPSRRARLPRASAAQRRPERHTIDSLDSLAVDIARMIDHDAAAELWDRYKRGERNVFTRKLYTMQGQKAFEEIRKQVPRRWRFQAHRRPLYRRVRAAARGSLARRPRPGGGAHLSHLGDGQGLHHARPRRRTVRLTTQQSTRAARDERARFVCGDGWRA